MMATDRVSVTFITKDRPGFAFLCLSSLLAQSFREWDLVVVDDSDPPLSRYVEFKFLFQLMEHYGHKVTLVEGQNLGITQGWQRGMELSDAPLGQRLEDDVWLEPTYLERLHRVIVRDGRIAAVAGSNPNPFHQNPRWEFTSFPNFLVIQQDSLIPIDGQNTLLDTDKTYGVCHLHGLFMYRTEAVQAVGGFATHMSRFGHRDETDLTLRLYFAGYELLVCPWARLWHAEAPYGGSREDRDREACLRDEEAFQQRLATWIKENPGKLVDGLADVPGLGRVNVWRRP